MVRVLVDWVELRLMISKTVAAEPGPKNRYKTDV